MEVYLIALLVVSILGCLVFLCGIEDRQISRYEALEAKHAFLCHDCQHVYIGSKDLVKCPHCGHKNSFLRF